MALFDQLQRVKDFEDAVVASTALAGECEMVVTRNVADFAQALIRALTPEGGVWGGERSS